MQSNTVHELKEKAPVLAVQVGQRIFFLLLTFFMLNVLY